MKVKAKIESLDFKKGEITLPKELENLSDILKTMPTWAEVCEERNRKMKE